MTSLKIVVASLMALTLLITVSAQTFQAQITGVLRGATGAVVPNARVVATNVATGFSYSTESNSQGIYRVLALPPGQYKVLTSMYSKLKLSCSSATRLKRSRSTPMPKSGHGSSQSG